MVNGEAEARSRVQHLDDGQQPDEVFQFQERPVIPLLLGAGLLAAADLAIRIQRSSSRRDGRLEGAETRRELLRERPVTHQELVAPRAAVSLVGALEGKGSSRFVVVVLLRVARFVVFSTQLFAMVR